jgi:uncharacterized protein (DUF1330 family)
LQVILHHTLKTGAWIMSAYIIAFVDVNDSERYRQDYVPLIMDTLKQYGGKIIVSSETAIVKEGHWPKGRTVVLQFDDLASAEKWYHSADYKPLIILREEIASSSLAFFDGVSK